MNTIDTETLRLLLLDRAGYLVLGSVFLLLGVVMIPVVLARRGPRYGVVLLFGVMSLLWGLRFLCRAPLVPLLVGGSPEFWPLFSRGLTYVSAPAGVAVMGLVFGRRLARHAAGVHLGHRRRSRWSRARCCC